MATSSARGAAFRRIGREVGGSAYLGPLLGFFGSGVGRLLRRADGAGPEQETEGWLIQADDVDDDLGRSGRVARPAGHGGLAITIHGPNRLVVVVTHLHTAHRGPAP